MKARPKILHCDDDPDLLDMYREILALLPSPPEIHTATSGPRALAMLEAEPFDLLICDLKMPKMDGFQVIETVRRKSLQLQTMVLTCNTDEQFRMRAYALGVDLFCDKPATEQETKMWLGKVGSLLARESGGSVPKPECSAGKEPATDTLAPVKKQRRSKPRIIVVNDEQWYLELLELVIPEMLTEVEVSLFQDANKAWQELLCTDPDLLITDDVMGQLNGDELVHRLVNKGASYPIVVASGYPPTKEWLQPYLDKYPNISFMPVPFTIEQLHAELSKNFTVKEFGQTCFAEQGARARERQRASSGSQQRIETEPGVAGETPVP